MHLGWTKKTRVGSTFESFKNLVPRRSIFAALFSEKTNHLFLRNVDDSNFTSGTEKLGVPSLKNRRNGNLQGAEREREREKESDAAGY